jgi:adhesin transport system membrane fusion protein
MNKQLDSNSARPLSFMWVIALVIAVFLVWAYYFEVDQAVRAQGQVISSSRTQVVQVADGGVLSRLLVREGQTVQKGELLAILEKERSVAAYEETKAMQAARAASLVRVNAEASGLAPVFGKEFKGFESLVAVQIQLYSQRKKALNDEIQVLQKSLDMAIKEQEMNEHLFASGDVSSLEVMRARRQVLEIRGRISATRNKYKVEAGQEASKVQEDLNAAEFKLDQSRSVLAHTELSAPVNGVVKLLKITTLGGVLRPGDELMQISPTEEDLLIEARVNPSDIGQLKLGLPVSVKLDAFDSSIFGILNGTLSYISSDTLQEQSANGQTTVFYRVQVKVKAPEQSDLFRTPIFLKPGMSASIDIRTQSRSILRYLLKPIFKSFDGALMER